jgi:hypothetical protein
MTDSQLVTVSDEHPLPLPLPPPTLLHVCRESREVVKYYKQWGTAYVDFSEDFVWLQGLKRQGFDCLMSSPFASEIRKLWVGIDIFEYDDTLYYLTLRFTKLEEIIIAVPKVWGDSFSLKRMQSALVTPKPCGSFETILASYDGFDTPNLEKCRSWADFEARFTHWFAVEQLDQMSILSPYKLYL